jgi:hypothetical protein
MPDKEGGGEVDEVIAADNYYPMGILDASLEENVLLPEIAANEASAIKAMVIGGATFVYDDDLEACHLQIFQDAPTDLAKAAKDDGLIHEGLW